MNRLAGMVELVTDIVMAASGLAKSKGSGDHPLESETAWHFGFYSRPKDGARGVVLKADGQGNTSFLIGYRDKQYELTLEKGEVGLKNAFDASILLDKNGNVNVDAANAAFVKLGGGAQFVALANLVNARISALVSYINGHTHPYVNGVASATTSAPTPTLAAQASVAAQNVKAT